MSQAMKKLVLQHLECDEQLNRCEAALHKGDMAAAARNFALFSQQLDAHFAVEEERLFPALEKATGMLHGPTVVMRAEHAEIRNLRDEARAAISEDAAGQALAILDTLNVLIQQHNIKEENILYPMCGGSIPELETVLCMNAGSTCCGACSCS
jgi:iron-sulfur cluster repair protein YtfE (RIC family)